MQGSGRQMRQSFKGPTGAGSSCEHSGQAMVRLHAGFPRRHEGALRGVRRHPPKKTDGPHEESEDGQPVAADLMRGRNLLYCGWRGVLVNLVLDPTIWHRPNASPWCSRLWIRRACTSRAREISRDVGPHPEALRPLRSEEHAMGIPGLDVRAQRRLSRDNVACKFVLDLQQQVVDRGGGGSQADLERGMLEAAAPAAPKPTGAFFTLISALGTRSISLTFTSPRPSILTAAPGPHYWSLLRGSRACRSSPALRAAPHWRESSVPTFSQVVKA